MEDGTLEAKARRLLSEFPLIDGHNDLPMQLRQHFQNQIYDKTRCDFRNGMFTHTDLIKLQQGKLGGQFWSVYVQCKPENTNWNEDDVCTGFASPTPQIVSNTSIYVLNLCREPFETLWSK
jgi:hypothetical protein